MEDLNKVPHTQVKYESVSTYFVEVRTLVSSKDAVCSWYTLL